MGGCVSSRGRVGRNWIGLVSAGVLTVILFAGGCDNYIGPNVTEGPANNSAEITMSPSGTIPVDIGKSITIYATFQADTTPPDGVTWTINGPGTLSNLTNSQVTYTAPSNRNMPASSITATAVADPTQFFTSIINITALPSFLTTTLPDATIGAGYVTSVAVTAGAPPFAFSIVSGALPPGITYSDASLNSIEISGTPPPSSAGNYTVTFKATDSTGGSATSQPLTITVEAASGSARKADPGVQPGAMLSGDSSNDALLSGNYAFVFTGLSGGSATGAAGSFVSDGQGNITGGLADRNGPAGPQTTLPFAGTYNVGADRLGIMVLQFADGSSATYAVAATAEGSARFIEFDDATGTGTHGSGEIEKQDTSAFLVSKLAGDYVFELNGADAAGGRLAMVGGLAASGSGSITQATLDANDAGRAVSFEPASGNFAVSATGRGNATLAVAPSGTFNSGTLNFSVYVVSANEWFAVETDPAGQPVLAGEFLRSTGPPNEFITKRGTNSLTMLFSNTTDGVQLSVTSTVSASAFHGSSSTSFNSASFTGTLTGASLPPASAASTEVLLALSFDGSGNVVLNGASSGPAGLQILSQQAGTYSVSGKTLGFSGVNVGSAAVGVNSVVSTAEVVLSPQDVASSPIVVQQ
jgi:hypothetical protein